MNDALPLAGRGRRLVATAIDAALVPSLTVFLVMVFGVVEDAEDYADNNWILHVFLLAVLSYLLLNGWGLWRHGQTIGKRCLGIAIVEATPEVESEVNSELARAAAGGAGVVAPTTPRLWKLIFVRAWFFPLLFVLPMPWLTLAPLIDQLLIFRKSRQCLHDVLSGTSVVRGRPQPE